MFNLFKNEKLPRGVRKDLAPSKEFTAKTRGRFLALFDAHYRTRTVRSRFAVVVKIFIAAGALVAVFASMSVYADTANVPADSTLYPLKRLSENVQLALTPASAKPELQATFATRRAAEIADLEARKPTSTIIASLAKDLDSDVDSSLNSAASANLQDGSLSKFCGKVLSAVASSSLALRNPSFVNTRIFVRFENRCGQVEDATTTFRAAGSFGVPLIVSTSSVSTSSSSRGTSASFRIGVPNGFRLLRVASGGRQGGVVSSTIRIQPLRERFYYQGTASTSLDDDQGDLDSSSTMFISASNSVQNPGGSHGFLKSFFDR